MSGAAPPKPRRGVLSALFAASAAVYHTLLALAPRYALDVAAIERPMLTVLGLYAAANALYFAALWATLRRADTRRLGWWILGTSVALRLVLLPTPPYQEIDIYRYLWDGAVVVEGVDPYAYPPQAIVSAIDFPDSARGDAILQRLAEHASRDRPLEEILRTVHYAELPSPYPPMSQAVFAAASAMSGDAWSADTRLIWLKAWLAAFDIGTLALVFVLVRCAGLHSGWTLAYGWCPLVLKEFAGSGHLDAIAVFFTTASLAVWAAACVGRVNARRAAIGASVLLGLGVGAKLYPVVLAPLLAIGVWRRLGPRATLIAGAAFLVTSAATLAPMLWPRAKPPAMAVIENTDAAESDAVTLPPPPGMVAVEPAATAKEKTAGLLEFLRSWEMNDLLFAILYENLRWHVPDRPSLRPWLDATPNAWSESLRERDGLAFAMTRAITAAASLVIALVLALRSHAATSGADAARRWLGAAFLTLAWFWLLAPTQNPWYWCWAAPLLPFARSRAWLFVSAASFGYYLRFWFESRLPETGVAGTPYDGAHFFYYVIPWMEFAPILLWLALEAAWRRANPQGVCSDAQNPIGPRP